MRGTFQSCLYAQKDSLTYREPPDWQDPPAAVQGGFKIGRSGLRAWDEWEEKEAEEKAGRDAAAKAAAERAKARAEAAKPAAAPPAKQRPKAAPAGDPKLARMETDRIERRITEIEARIRAIDDSMLDPKVHSDPQKSRQLTQERERLQQELEPLEFEWSRRAE